MRVRLGVSLLLAGCLETATATAQWIGFDDEAAGRLSLQAFADAPLDDPLNDGAEKDMAVADLNLDGWQDIVVVRKEPFSNPGPRQDVLLMNENGTLIDRTGLLAPGFIATLTDSRDVFIGGSVTRAARSSGQAGRAGSGWRGRVGRASGLSQTDFASGRPGCYQGRCVLTDPQ